MEIRFNFVSIYDASQFSPGDVQETFTDNAYEDTAFDAKLPLADWNKGATEGLLAGAFTAGTVTISTNSFGGEAYPLQKCSFKLLKSLSSLPELL